MLVCKIITVILLLTIFLQDLKEKAVYWAVFPVLAVMLMLIRRDCGIAIPDIITSGLINSAFITVQLTLLSLYFSVKNRKWVNITNHLLGLADILFIGCIALYLPVVHFLIFYIGSLTIVLLSWLFYKQISPKHNQFIPLAGLQAIIAMVLFTADWWLIPLDLTSDAPLLNWIAK